MVRKGVLDYFLVYFTFRGYLTLGDGREDVVFLEVHVCPDCSNHLTLSLLELENYGPNVHFQRVFFLLCPIARVADL